MGVSWYALVKQTYLAGHNVTKQHDVTWIDSHTVLVHGVLNFVNNSVSERMDRWVSQYGKNRT